jgi:protein SCO1/2
MDLAHEELPILMTLPEFTLTDQTENAFGTAQLDGKVWVANFMFTRCPTTCPIQTANMARLQTILNRTPEESAVRFLSISVDPDYDTPSVLKRYSEQVAADSARWRFLTGDRETIWTLCKNGFRMPVSNAPLDSASPILHSQRFIVVDQQRRVRGLYDGTKSEDVQQIALDISKLLLHPPSGSSAAGSVVRNERGGQGVSHDSVGTSSIVIK